LTNKPNCIMFKNSKKLFPKNFLSFEGSKFFRITFLLTQLVGHYPIFLSENTEIYKNDSEKLIYFMIYNNSYLFIGHFPNNKVQILSSIGY